MPMETRHDLEHTTERLTEGLRCPWKLGQCQATLCVQSAQYRTRSSEIALLRCCVFADSRLRKNAMVCLRWHGTGLNSTDYLSRVITVRQFENSDIRFSSLASQQYFNINGNLKR